MKTKQKPIMNYESVKTYEDVLGESGMQHFDETNLRPDEIARRKLEIIIEYLNGEWKANMLDFAQEKWYAVFIFGHRPDGQDKFLVWPGSNIGPSGTLMYIGHRLYLKSRELALYVGERFWYLYYEMLGINL